MADPLAARTPRSDAAPGAEARALTRVYRLAPRACERKKGARPGAPDDVRRLQDAHPAEESILG